VTRTHAREGSQGPAHPHISDRLRRAAIYAGGTLGPLGGGVVAPMLPRLAASLHASSDAVAASLTAYFIPFAAIQLVSGSLGERWGRRRTVRTAYLLYLLASLGCALAPGLPLFLLWRAVLGVANAFTTPLLLAGLADVVPRRRLGRSVGLYSSCTAAGQSFAPLLGGMAAGVSWRLAFVIVAAVAALLASAPPPGEPRPGASAPPWRPLASRRMGLLSLAALVSFMGSAGLPFLVALQAHDALGLSPGLTGLALVGFGLAGLVLGSVWGAAADRFGARACGIIAAIATAPCVGVVGVIGSVSGLAACWTAAGAASSLLTVALQSLTVRTLPTNRGGALSVVSAFRFVGSAVAPATWLPLYHSSPASAFAAAGGSVLLAVPALALLRKSAPDLAGAG
jgi:MFS family permease